MSRAVLVCCGLALGSLGACTGSAAPDSAAQGAASVASAGGNGFTDAPDDSGTGWVVVELEDYPMYQEGFAYGVRLEVDGDVVVERQLKEFTTSGDPLPSRSWTTRLEVPAGGVTVASDLSVGAGPPPEPPDFASPCRTSVTVESGRSVALVLEWSSGCLEPTG